MPEGSVPSFLRRSFAFNSQFENKPLPLYFAPQGDRIEHALDRKQS
jgi:hypothetical protein